MRGLRATIPRTSTSTAIRFALPSHHIRCLHSSTPRQPIPSPTPFCPDPTTFLTLIGRQLSQHASKIPTWEALFSLSSPQLRELGVEPARTRRYLLHWRERFRKGQFGIGGDLRRVDDAGVAELRVIEVPAAETAAEVQARGGGLGPVATATRSPGMRKVVVNVRPGEDIGDVREWKDAVVPSMIHLVRGHAIRGSYVQPVKGTGGGVARLAVQEGLWEQKRGHKVDGGERRKAEVRAKRRSQERKDAR